MTTFAKTNSTCGACGHEFSHNVLTSTNTFGSSDLDTRPPEMKRSTMGVWVESCPSCGYCAGDVEEFDERYRAVMESDAYRSQLAHTAYPALASAFICFAMLSEAADRRDDAGWAYLHAAWDLDDAETDDLARMCRDKAAAHFLSLLDAGRPFVNQDGASEAIVTDCLRRAGKGPRALEIADRALSHGCEDFIRQVLAFQRALIQRGDTACHRMDEAVESE